MALRGIQEYIARDVNNIARVENNYFGHQKPCMDNNAVYRGGVQAIIKDKPMKWRFRVYIFQKSIVV